MEFAVKNKMPHHRFLYWKDKEVSDEAFCVINSGR